jgi:hypothetical protein
VALAWSRARHRPRTRDQRGIALVITLLALVVCTSLALSIALSSSFGRYASANHAQALRLLNAAEAAVELAARDLSLLPDWSDALAGARLSSVVDGAPAGVRTPLPGLTLDLTRLTSQLTCGRVIDCADAEVAVSTGDRPWGTNNPRWRPYLYGRVPDLADPLHPTPPYVVVWIGDDASEMDADPRVDGGAAGGEGRYILRARAEAFDPQGARRAIEVELARVCTAPGVCLPGIVVQSWRTITATVP